MDKTTRSIVTDDTEFYGFLNGKDIVEAGRLAEILRSPAICAIYQNDTFASVAEEIAYRGGMFYTGIEAKKLAPWNMMNTRVYAGKFPYIEGDIRSENPAYADFDWCILDDVQYNYGMYLSALIADKKLKPQSRTETK